MDLLRQAMAEYAQANGRSGDRSEPRDSDHEDDAVAHHEID